MSGLLAARRDATFYRNPAGHGHDPRPTSMHAIVVRGDGTLGPACGIPFHDEGTEEPAFGLMESEKCRRPGCRQAFTQASAREASDG